jgi:hypothetical protein
MTEIADVLDRYPELKAQAEIVSVLNLLAVSKQGLREILERYGVAAPEEVKAKISKGVIPEHPAYEDYLDALAYALDIKAVGETLRKKIHEFLA